MAFSGTVGFLEPLMDNNLPKYSKFLWYRVPLFDYRYQAESELIFEDTKSNTKYALDHHFETDGGSIPPMLRFVPFVHLDPFNFTRSYLYHDCAYQYGGLYIKYPHDGVYKFRLMHRREVDNLLGILLPYDGATKLDVATISSALRIGSRFVWNSKKAEAQHIERVKCNISVYDKSGALIEAN